MKRKGRENGDMKLMEHFMFHLLRWDHTKKVLFILCKVTPVILRKVLSSGKHTHRFATSEVVLVLWYSYFTEICSGSEAAVPRQARISGSKNLCIAQL